MGAYYTYPGSDTPTPRQRRIAIVTQGVKLPGEERGYTRFRFLSELLVQEGFEVDLITSTFQHWDKEQRDTTNDAYQGLPYRIRFVYEPGYKRNLDLARINSHRLFARNLEGLFRSRFSDNPKAYDLIYSEIPPNDMARTCAETAQRHGIPYVADINDLWPEAMRMALDIPVVSDIAFASFGRDAKRTYELVSAAVGTSDEYAARPAADREKPYERRTVYVGNDLAAFDAGAALHAGEMQKPASEFWIIYTGTFGASYDLSTLVEAASIIGPAHGNIRVKMLGDGPDREKLENLARKLDAPVDFVGYAPYDVMAAYLSASDVAVNSLVKTAAQSIVTKIGDYLAAGIPMINTGSSPEMRRLVEENAVGLNVEAGDVESLASAIIALENDPELCSAMGRQARKLAEERFDRAHSYRTIVELIRDLTN